MAWCIREAKQRFSELVRRALVGGPRRPTGRGEEVVVSAEESRGLRRESMDFKAFLLSGPDLSKLDIQRSREIPRHVEL